MYVIIFDNIYDFYYMNTFYNYILLFHVYIFLIYIYGIFNLRIFITWIYFMKINGDFLYVYKFLEYIC